MIYDYILSNSSEFIAVITLIITAGTVVGSALKYFHDKDAGTVMISCSLYAELENTKDILEDQGMRNNYGVKPDDENEEPVFYFIKKLFNHDVYDSLIYSAKINYLGTELQQTIQDIFRTIKMHNEYVILISYMNSQPTDDRRASDRTYSKWLNEHEEILRKEIPQVMEKLEIRRHILVKRIWMRLLHKSAKRSV